MFDLTWVVRIYKQGVVVNVNSVLSEDRADRTEHPVILIIIELFIRMGSEIKI